ncbi:MAG TPA: hypothetical protein PLN69_05485 [bacterium]|nr:hypothetical protein [bacterium]
MKKFLFVAIIIFVTALLVIVASEVALRLIGSTPAQFYKCRDDAVHHKLRPGYRGRVVTPEYRVVYKANSKGFRGSDRAIAKTGRVTRIVVLGDSFTMGQGVREEAVFTSLLENKLNNAWSSEGRKFEVINLGMQSYSPLIEYIALKNYGLEYDPDMVILMLDWSDFQDDMTYERRTVFDDAERPVMTTAENPAKGSLEFLGPVIEASKKTYLYHFVRNRLRKTAVSATENIIPGDPVTDRYAILRDPPPEAAGELYDRTQKYIRMVSELAVENDITFMMVLYPYGVHVGGDEWGEGRKQFLFQEGTTISSKPFEIMEKFADEYDIECLNLLEPFRDSKESSLFFPYDGHFTESGHELVSDTLFDYINTKFSAE